MAKIEDWHREAATEIMREIMCTEGNTTGEELAQLIASHDPSNADRDKVIEKYAVVEKDGWFELRHGNRVVEAWRDSDLAKTAHYCVTKELTRFADEIGSVDVEKVWAEFIFNKYVERLACPECHDVDTEQDGDGWRCYGCSHKFKHHKIIIWLSKDQLAAALLAAGGKK